MRDIKLKPRKNGRRPTRKELDKLNEDGSIVFFNYSDTMEKAMYYRDLEIKIFQDTSPMNPRDDECNLARFACECSRCELGDTDIENDDVENAFSVPLYLYDHGMVELSMIKQCNWDSSHAGYAYITEEHKKAFGAENFTDEQLTKQIQNELDIYNMYLNCDVYGYNVDFADGEVASVWGYYGVNHEENGLLDSAKTEIDTWLERNEIRYPNVIEGEVLLSKVKPNKDKVYYGLFQEDYLMCLFTTKRKALKCHKSTPIKFRRTRVNKVTMYADGVIIVNKENLNA